MKQEFIICSAIWYKNIPMVKQIEGTNPINIDKGLVVCGRRHCNCIWIVSSLTGLRSVENAPDGAGESIQGFVTNTNRFVDRQEAYDIAYKANQIISINKNRPTNEIGLTSEDLY